MIGQLVVFAQEADSRLNSLDENVGGMVAVVYIDGSFITYWTQEQNGHVYTDVQIVIWPFLPKIIRVVSKC